MEQLASPLGNIPQCLLDLYKNVDDEAAIKQTLQRWNKKKAILNPNNQAKCSKKAKKLIRQGNRLFARSPSSTDELFKFYIEAIACAPNDSPELGKAYAYRSEVLGNVGLYEDSLKDINRALASNCPDILKFKLYERKARNLSALTPEKRPEIEEAIAEARRWVIKVNDANRELVLLGLNELSNQKTFPEPFKMPDHSIIAPDILDTNKTLIGASSAIELKYSDEFGRHFVATRDINVGETFIKEKSYESVTHSPRETMFFYCCNCSKRAWSGVPCKHCTATIYCNEDCRDDAWRRYHDIECSIIDDVYTDKTADTELMGLRITIKALREAGSIELLREKLKKIDSISDPLARVFNDGKANGSNYNSIYPLQIDIILYFYYIICLDSCALMLLALGRRTTVFGKHNNKIHELMNNDSVIFIGGLMLKNIRICAMNSDEIQVYNKNQVVGNRTVLSCLISYFNHSCDANACRTSFGDTEVVNSTQLIKKGEQVFICYNIIDEIQSDTGARQFYFQEHNFSCKCILCQQDQLSIRPRDVSFKNQQLSFEAKRILELKLYEFYSELLNNGISPDEFNDILTTDVSYIPHSSDLVNTLCKYANYPCKEIWDVKNLLTLNYIHNSN